MKWQFLNPAEYYYNGNTVIEELMHLGGACLNLTFSCSTMYEYHNCYLLIQLYKTYVLQTRECVFVLVFSSYIFYWIKCFYTIKNRLFNIAFFFFFLREYTQLSHGEGCPDCDVPLQIFWFWLYGYHVLYRETWPWRGLWIQAILLPMSRCIM